MQLKNYPPSSYKTIIYSLFLSSWLTVTKYTLQCAGIYLGETTQAHPSSALIKLSK